MVGKIKPSEILPEYPRTRHLPWKPNAARDDLVVTDEEARVIFDSAQTTVEEKVDGASAAIARFDGYPIIRNRQHILKKGYVKKETPAKLQFRPIWNWYYQNEKLFKRLATLTGDTCSVYGEWMYAAHGLKYTRLPDLFIAFDLYDYSRRCFVDSSIARNMLEQAGFKTPPLLHRGKVESYEQLEALANGNTPYADEQREGLYLKVSEGGTIKHRFKMVRQGFLQGALWNPDELSKNVVCNE